MSSPSNGFSKHPLGAGLGAGNLGIIDGLTRFPGFHSRIQGQRRVTSSRSLRELEFRGSITSTFRPTAYFFYYLRLIHFVTSMNPRLYTGCAGLRFPEGTFTPCFTCASQRTARVQSVKRIFAAPVGCGTRRWKFGNYRWFNWIPGFPFTDSGHKAQTDLR